MKQKRLKLDIWVDTGSEYQFEITGKMLKTIGAVVKVQIESQHKGNEVVISLEEQDNK